MAFKILHYDVLDSTNKEAVLLAKKQGANHVVVVANRQEAGYGKQKRHWVSESGNLYCSIVVRPNKPILEAQQLVYVAAVALCNALAQLGVEGQVKWPNDVLLNEHKIAGILLESGLKAGQIDYVIVGVGVNVAHAPSNTSFPASFLNNYQPNITVKQLLDQFVSQFELVYAQWTDEGFAPIKTQWEQHIFAKGRTFVARTPQKDYTGKIKGLDLEGNLQLVDHNDMSHTIVTADLFLD